jgi:molybdate transport system substrate-binding protein
MRWALVALLIVFAGCGGDDKTIVVSAATSLTDALTSCSRQFDGAKVRLSFAGSDELAAQIRQGVKPDVYAAANTKLPDQLASEGRLEKPVTFATNELVIAVPEDSDVAALDDLAKPGVKLVIGSETVPVGAYTRTVLDKLPTAEEQQVMGFVYRTDLVDGLKAITLPQALQPVVEYGAGVVKGAKQPGLAKKYLDGLTDGACADALRSGGFGRP